MSADWAGGANLSITPLFNNQLSLIDKSAEGPIIAAQAVIAEALNVQAAL
jgi:hypothetical protein